MGNIGNVQRTLELEPVEGTVPAAVEASPVGELPDGTDPSGPLVEFEPVPARR